MTQDENCSYSTEIVKKIMTVIAEDCGETYESLKGYTNDEELPGMVSSSLYALDYWMWRCKAIEQMVKVPSDEVLHYTANRLREEWKSEKEAKLKELYQMLEAE